MNLGRNEVIKMVERQNDDGIKNKAETQIFWVTYYNDNGNIYYISSKS